MLDGCNFNEEDGLYIRLKKANITFIKAAVTSVPVISVFLSPVWVWHIKQ